MPYEIIAKLAAEDLAHNAWRGAQHMSVYGPERIGLAIKEVVQEIQVEHDKKVADLEREIKDLKNCLSALTQERESFIQFCNSIGATPGFVGPLQVARQIIERLQAQTKTTPQPEGEHFCAALAGD